MKTGNAHIAIVDDEESVRRAFARLLTSEGYVVEQFSGGHAFLSSLDTRVPDCLVLDLHMPGVDGFAVLKALSARTPRPPVVVITGYDSAETRLRIKEAGGCTFLRKPVDGTLLMNTMRRAMGTSAQSQSDPDPTSERGVEPQEKEW